MLQNRVDPYGNLIRTEARGSLTGNRGVIHNAEKEIVRPYKLKAWITCLLEFKGWKRTVMSPNRWTELFFLDEATAFAAGHRPCSECRRKDFKVFKVAWLKGNPEYGFTEKTSIKEIDVILHQERIDAEKAKKTYQEDIEQIPDGVFIRVEDVFYLIADHRLWQWSPFGYSESVIVLRGRVSVLTPRSVVNAFRAGYLPQLAISKLQ